MKITSIRQQVKRSDRYSIDVNGAFAFGISEGALLEHKLFVGMELDDAAFAELKDAASLDKLYNAALRYAALRPRSEWEVQTYLERKGVDPPQAQQMLERLRRLGFLDDQKFAEVWIANRRLLKATSKRKLQMELKQKHVPSQIIDEALSADETSDDHTLQVLIHKKRARYPEAQKLIAYLARQGFAYEDIKRALETTD